MHPAQRHRARRVRPLRGGAVRTASRGADMAPRICSKFRMKRDHETLGEVGRALYGEAWQSPLARDLDVNLRTLQRWAAGDFQIPEGIWAEIAPLCKARSAALAKWEKRLSA